LLPHGLYVLRHRLRAISTAESLIPREVLAANACLRNRHAGQRCFILGNGPSVKQIDLSYLRGETVFSVSNGYLHKGYATMAPAYHCVPQITYGRMTEAQVVSWFREMDQRIGQAELFLSETEAALVHQHGLFLDRKVHYLAFRSSFDDYDNNRIIDLVEPVPRVESVPVMALMIAMYLGFKEIVLVGVDHDHFKTGRYLYAFEPQVQKGKDYAVGGNGEVLISRHDDFQSLARLWRQYRVIRKIAMANGVSIVNASHSSELDEFTRTTLNDVLRGTK
jgi:hypothetical protein